MGWKSALFGSTDTKQQNTLLPGQIDYINKGTSLSTGYLPENLSTINNYANNLSANSSWDSVGADKAYGNMANQTEMDRRKQISAVNGGALNRFSLASNSAQNNINSGAMANQNQLGMNKLNSQMSEENNARNQQSKYLQAILGYGSGISGQKTFDNKDSYNPGALAVANGVSSLVGNAGLAKKAFV